MTVADAVLALARAAVSPVHDGYVPLGPDGLPVDVRYAVLYAAPGRRYSEDVANTQSFGRFTFQITSVGRTRQQAEAVAVRIRDALVGARPVAAPWTCGPIEHVGDEPIRRSDDVPGDVPIFSCADTYTVAASR